MTDYKYNYGTMGPEWIDDQIRRANPEEVVAKIRYHDITYPPMERMTRVYGHDMIDATYTTPDKKPGMAETPGELWRMIWSALAMVAVMALPFVAGALVWRMI